MSEALSISRPYSTDSMILGMRQGFLVFGNCHSYRIADLDVGFSLWLRHTGHLGFMAFRVSGCREFGAGVVSV